jgi:hypothetical protein
VNKAIQRSLTKAVARHGLGLYIYAGEDLPEDEKVPETPVYCEECALQIKPVTLKNGEIWNVENIVTFGRRMFGKTMCGDCQKKAKGEGK